MTTRKSPDRTGPLPLGTVIDRSRAIIADQPDAAEIEKIVRAEIAERLAKQKAAAQQKLDALRARLTEADDARYEKSLLAALDGDLCGFSLGKVAENDAAPENGGEIPERLREPLDEKRLSIGKGR